MKSKTYNEFVEKFKPKKTTDDCYTPDNVYQCIVDYCKKTFDINGKEIIRPFYPGGDYENYKYPDNCVVIDNPPFSILSKIRRFYLERSIKYFLFAPHLTVLSSRVNDMVVLVGGVIKYANGAQVRTSFVTNLEEEIRICNCVTLYERLKEIQDDKKHLPKYQKPVEVITVSDIQKYTEAGINISFDRDEVLWVEKLKDENNNDIRLFGYGLLMSKDATRRRMKADELLYSLRFTPRSTPRDRDLILSDEQKELITKLK